MATLAQLKTRIILELARDDMGTSGELEQALADSIDRAIEYHADEQFWFNHIATSLITTAALATTDIPASVRHVRSIGYGNPDTLLTRSELGDIEQTSATGKPTHFAQRGDTIRWYPVPDNAYSLNVYGVAELGTPASAASNAWTIDALDLIDATARKILYRDYLRDPEGAELAGNAEQDALNKLRRETRRRGKVPLRSRGDAPFLRDSFIINVG